LEVITEAEARLVIGNLEHRPDTEQNGAYAPTVPYDPAAEPEGWDKPAESEAKP
jgi:hypothetical protein